MFVGYEVLDKETRENASEDFSREMRKIYKSEDGGGTCMNNVNIRFYRINANNNNVVVSDEFLYPNRNTSTIIFERNHTKISEIKSELEEETKNFKLKLTEKGKG